jgi:hypothetical protein
MGNSFKITFSNELTAYAIRVHRSTELSIALHDLGLHYPHPTLVLVGGAGELRDVELARLRPLFVEVLAPLFEVLGAFVVDGGTDAGVMRLMGEARGETGATFSLIGVPAAGLVTLPGATTPRAEAAPLEPHHTHFVLVPGSKWGDDSPWLSRVASTLGSGKPSLTLLINGGEITREDVSQSVKAGRPVVVVGGTGRLADEIAIAAERLSLVNVVDLEEGSEKVAAVVSSFLKGG